MIGMNFNFHMVYYYIYQVESEEEVSSMTRFAEGIMLPNFHTASTIEEEKLEWRRLTKNHERLLKNTCMLQQDTYHKLQ